MPQQETPHISQETQEFLVTHKDALGDLTKEDQIKMVGWLGVGTDIEDPVTIELLMNGMSKFIGDPEQGIPPYVAMIAAKLYQVQENVGNPRQRAEILIKVVEELGGEDKAEEFFSEGFTFDEQEEKWGFEPKAKTTSIGEFVEKAVNELEENKPAQGSASETQAQTLAPTEQVQATDYFSQEATAAGKEFYKDLTEEGKAAIDGLADALIKGDVSREHANALLAKLPKWKADYKAAVGGKKLDVASGLLREVGMDEKLGEALMAILKTDLDKTDVVGLGNLRAQQAALEGAGKAVAGKVVEIEKAREVADEEAQKIVEAQEKIKEAFKDLPVEIVFGEDGEMVVDVKDGNQNKLNAIKLTIGTSLAMKLEDFKAVNPDWDYTYGTVRKSRQQEVIMRKGGDDLAVMKVEDGKFVIKKAKGATYGSFADGGIKSVQAVLMAVGVKVELQVEQPADVATVESVVAQPDLTQPEAPVVPEVPAPNPEELERGDLDELIELMETGLQRVNFHGKLEKGASIGPNYKTSKDTDPGGFTDKGPDEELEELPRNRNIRNLMSAIYVLENGEMKKLMQGRVVVGTMNSDVEGMAVIVLAGFHEGTNIPDPRKGRTPYRISMEFPKEIAEKIIGGLKNDPSLLDRIYKDVLLIDKQGDEAGLDRVKGGDGFYIIDVEELVAERVLFPVSGTSAEQVKAFLDNRANWVGLELTAPDDEPEVPAEPEAGAEAEVAEQSGTQFKPEVLESMEPSQAKTDSLPPWLEKLKADETGNKAEPKTISGGESRVTTMASQPGRLDDDTKLTPTDRSPLRYEQEPSLVQYHPKDGPPLIGQIVEQLKNHDQVKIILDGVLDARHYKDLITRAINKNLERFSRFISYSALGISVGNIDDGNNIPISIRANLDWGGWLVFKKQADLEMSFVIIGNRSGLVDSANRKIELANASSAAKGKVEKVKGVLDVLPDYICHSIFDQIAEEMEKSGIKIDDDYQFEIRGGQILMTLKKLQPPAERETNPRGLDPLEIFGNKSDVLSYIDQEMVRLYSDTIEAKIGTGIENGSLKMVSSGITSSQSRSLNAFLNQQIGKGEKWFTGSPGVISVSLDDWQPEIEVKKGGIAGLFGRTEMVEDKPSWFDPSKPMNALILKFNGKEGGNYDRVVELQMIIVVPQASVESTLREMEQNYKRFFELYIAASGDLINEDGEPMNVIISEDNPKIYFS